MVGGPGGRRGAVRLRAVGRTDAQKRYWDERARENALYFVDTGVGYEDPDVEAFWRRGEEVVERMTAQVGLEIEPDAVVVDIGCGVGRLTRALAARAERVYGIDVSEEMLARAREHNAELENVEWLHGSGHDLSGVPDGAVDGCFSHVVFQHIPDPAVTLSYIRDMGRVLRPSGWALFQVSTDPAVHRRPSGLRARAKALLRSDEAWWGSAVAMDDVRRAAAEGGVDIETVLDEGTQYTTVLGRRRH